MPLLATFTRDKTPAPFGQATRTDTMLNTTSRRAFLELAAAAGVAATGVTPALAQNVALKDLLAEQALPDV